MTLTGNNPTINAGSGKPFTVKAERIDNFNGPIRVDIAGLPPGLVGHHAAGHSGGTVRSDRRHQRRRGCRRADRRAAQGDQGHGHGRRSAARSGRRTSTASARSSWPPSRRWSCYLEPLAGTKPGPGESPATSTPTPEPGCSRLITIAPGGTVTCKLRVERNGFDDRIAFDVANLPHGVIVDDIGLSGVLIPEKQTERTIFLRAEPWVAEQNPHVLRHRPGRWQPVLAAAGAAGGEVTSAPNPPQTAQSARRAIATFETSCRGGRTSAACRRAAAPRPAISLMASIAASEPTVEATALNTGNSRFQFGGGSG